MKKTNGIRKDGRLKNVKEETLMEEYRMQMIKMMGDEKY